ncbi:MAG: DUF434 domain-containing protein [Thermofilum sp.]|jgi:hypothetical protein|nr:DUF434 domain-containing protein [Thermofilum sp.]
MPSSRPSPLKLEVTERLASAAADFFYLLERGYDRKVSLDLVTSRWGLSRLERAALYRSVFDSKTLAQRASKIVADPPEKLAVDGFNVLSTVESALIGDSLLLAMDGLVRDLSASVRKVAVDRLLAAALSVLLSTLSRLGVREVVFVFDAQVSRSGEFARVVRGLLPSYVDCGEVLVSSRADNSLIALSRSYPVASSDSLLVDRVAAVFDAGGFASFAVAAENVINFKELVEAEVKRVAARLAEGAGAADA